MIAYIIRANRNTEPMLCVSDSDNGSFHQWPISIRNCARLAAECSDILNIEHGGVDNKAALRDVVVAWSRGHEPPST